MGEILKILTEDRPGVETVSLLNGFDLGRVKTAVHPAEQGGHRVARHGSWKDKVECQGGPGRQQIQSDLPDKIFHEQISSSVRE